MFDREAFKIFYRFIGERFGTPGHRDPIMLHYNHFSCGSGQHVNSFFLSHLLGLKPGARCILVGAGFGWTGDALTDQGIEVVGTEISDYILAEKDNTEEAELREYITDVGIDPDNDEIIGPQYDPRCVIKIPQYKYDAWDKYILSEEYEQRKKVVIDWQNKSEEEKRKIRVEMNQLDYEPVMPTGPKPEFMINPLDLFLNGGRAAPRQRTSIVLADEGLGTLNSQTAVRQLLNDNPTHIITEEVLNSISDEDALILCDNLSNFSNLYGGEIFHILSPKQLGRNQHEICNWKFYSEWRKFLDDYNFKDHKIIPSVGCVTELVPRYGRVL